LAAVGWLALKLSRRIAAVRRVHLTHPATAATVVVDPHRVQQWRTAGTCLLGPLVRSTHGSWGLGDSKLMTGHLSGKSAMPGGCVAFENRRCLLLLLMHACSTLCAVWLHAVLYVLHDCMICKSYHACERVSCALKTLREPTDGREVTKCLPCGQSARRHAQVSWFRPCVVPPSLMSVRTASLINMGTQKSCIRSLRGLMAPSSHGVLTTWTHPIVLKLPYLQLPSTRPQVCA